jgi:tetratricopeptide (TPR) repeat protein
MGISDAIPALVLACLAGPFSPPAYSSVQEKASQAAAPAHSAASLQQAESLLEKQQYIRAEEQLQELAKTDARNPQVWFDLGFAESNLDKTPDAVTAYKKATELSPKWFEAQLNLGVELAKSGNYADASKPLSTAVQLKPTTGGQQATAKAWFALAQVLEETDPKQALNAYQQFAKLHPGPDAALASGRLMERTGDPGGAEQQYLQATQMEGGKGMEQLIDLYLKQKRFPDAENWLRKYSEKNPDDARAQVELGRVLAAEGKTKDAIASLEMANKKASDPLVMRELAGLYADDKQYAPAAQLFQQLVQAKPADADLRWNLGEAWLHQHNYSAAEAELLKALQFNPKLADAYWELAYAADQNKHYVLAVNALDARARLLPETAATYWLRATSYDNLKAYKPAAENYKKFLAASAGKSPDQEFQARHRLKAIAPE